MNFIKKILLFFVPIKYIINKYNPIFLYHSLGIESNFNTNIDHVDLITLEKQLRYIKKYWKFVTIDEFVNAKNRKGLTSLTVDDGYKNIIEEALIIFEKLEIPLTIFINSSTLKGEIFWRDKIRYLIENKLIKKFVSNSKLFNEKDINNFYYISKNSKFNSKQIEIELNEFFLKENILLNKNHKLCLDDKKYLIKHPLITYGNHTASHYFLSSLNKEEQYRDILECKNFLESFDVNRSNVFCVPFGGMNSFNEDTVNILKNLNYKTLLLTENKLNNFEDKHIIYRIMPSNFDIKNFLKKIYLKQIIFNKRY